MNETQLFNSTTDGFFNSTFINTTLLIDTRCCNRKLYGIGVLAVLLYALCLAGAVTAGILGVIAYWEVAPRPLRTTAGIIHLIAVPMTLIAAAGTPRRPPLPSPQGDVSHVSLAMLGWFLGDASTADVPRPTIKYAQIIAFVVPFTCVSKTFDLSLTGCLVDT